MISRITLTIIAGLIFSTLVYAANVTTCGTLNENTLIISDINTTGTCFTINASNIVLDGNGFTLLGNNSLTSAGVINTGFSNVTIRNMVIVNTSQGIVMTTPPSSNGTIFNNTINTSNSASLNGDGVPIIINNSTNINISENRLHTNGASAQGFIFVFNATDNTFANNIVTTSGSDAPALLFVFNAGDNNITSNTLSTTGQGITIQSTSNRLRITSNNITSGGSGINIEGASSNHTILSNTIVTNGSGSVGLRISSSNNSLYQSNNIRTISNNSEGFGIESGSSFNTIISNTVITSDFDSHGVEMGTFSNSNRFIANTINMSGDSSKGFLISNSTDTLIENNTIIHTGAGDAWAVVLNNGANGTNITNNIFNIDSTSDLQLQNLIGALLTNQFVRDYNINDAQFGVRNTSAGELQFLTNVSPLSGFNLSRQIHITTNRIFVDSVAQPAFNVSANLSFFNINAIGITNRTPFRNGAPCGGICTVIQDADTYIFNVTQFTNYSVGGLEVIVFNFDKTDTPDPVLSGAQLSYTIYINITNGTMYNAVLNETYPAGVVFSSSSPAPTSGNNTFFLGNLSAGNYTINITVNVTAPAGTTLVNNVTLTFENSSGTIFTFNETATTTVGSQSTQTSGGGGGGSSSTVICPLSCAKMSDTERAKSTYCSSLCSTPSQTSTPTYSVPELPHITKQTQPTQRQQQTYNPPYQPVKEVPLPTKEDPTNHYYILSLLAIVGLIVTIYFAIPKKR